MAEEQHGEWEWPATALGRHLAQLEKSLGCPICGNVLSVPTIISKCGHFFCSECVQRSLDFKGECPSCRCKVAGTHELVAARAIEDACQAFQQSRQQLLSLLQDGRVPTAKGRPPSSSATSSKSKHPMRRVTKLNYAMIKDNKLREALAQEGLRTHGSKETLVWRHREYTRLHNIQLEAKVPLSHKEIVQEVMRREDGRTQDQRNARVAEAIARDVVQNRQSKVTKKAKKQFAQMIKTLKAAKQSAATTTSSTADATAAPQDTAMNGTGEKELGEPQQEQNQDQDQAGAELNGIYPANGALDEVDEVDEQEEEQEEDENCGTGLGADWLAWRVVAAPPLLTPVFYNTRSDVAQVNPPEELLLEPDQDTLTTIGAQCPTAIIAAPRPKRGRPPKKHMSASDADDDFGLTPSSQTSDHSARSQPEKRDTPQRSTRNQQRMQNQDPAEVITIPGDDEWSCQRCTFFNKHGVTTCEMCGWTPPARTSRSSSRISGANMLSAVLTGSPSASSKRQKRSL